MIERRLLLSWVASACPWLVYPPILRAATSEEQVVRFRWAVPEQFEETAVEALGEPVESYDVKAKGALVIIAGVVALVYLARSVLRLRDEILGGTVIDVRSEEYKIDRDRDLPGGTILVLSNDGAKLYEREEIPDPSALVKALRPGG